MYIVYRFVLDIKSPVWNSLLDPIIFKSCLFTAFKWKETELTIRSQRNNDWFLSAN